MTDFIKIYHDKYDGMVGFLDDKNVLFLMIELLMLKQIGLV